MTFRTTTKASARSLLLIALYVAATACGNSIAAFDAGAVDGPAADGPIADATPDGRVNDAGVSLPDITLNPNRLIVDLAVEEKNFPADSCELDPDEACVGAPGDRRLLRFSIETPNIGTGDLFLGTPSAGNDAFQFSACHNHYHFVGYAEYQLINTAGGTVGAGQKQAFCLLDTHKYLTADPTVSDTSMYWCGYQGIQRGWSDVYTANLPCQFLDITDVADGNYLLRVTLNRDQTLAELNYSNNVVEVPVTIGNPDYETPTEDCPVGVDAHSVDGLHRECGWTYGGNFPCTPGETVDVGCSAAGMCALGSCTGNPMMRVCDPQRPDGNCSNVGKLSEDDDSCGTECPFVNNVVCPTGGSLDVYHAPVVHGAAYTCNVAVN